MDIITSILATPAYAETTVAAGAPGVNPAPQDNVFASLIPFVFIFVIFYFLIIRPQQRKFKQHQATVAGIKRGDKVILSSGIMGKVTKDAVDGILDIEISDGVTVKVVSSMVSTVETKEVVSNDNRKKK